jgi:hypothetical protein
MYLPIKSLIFITLLFFLRLSAKNADEGIPVRIYLTGAQDEYKENVSLDETEIIRVWFPLLNMCRRSFRAVRSLRIWHL